MFTYTPNENFFETKYLIAISLHSECKPKVNTKLLENYLIDYEFSKI